MIIVNPWIIEKGIDHEETYLVKVGNGDNNRVMALAHKRDEADCIVNAILKVGESATIETYVGDHDALIYIIDKSKLGVKEG